MSLSIKAIPAFSDNYIWLFHHEANQSAFVVDPGQAAPVLAALDKYSLRLDGVLVTHQHPDHIGGIPDLLTSYPGIPIAGPKDIAIVNRPLSDGDTFTMAELNFTTIAVPGHTLNHLAFYSETDAEPILFCGDTLFSGGCGRLFEGTAQQMLHSLDRLSTLPPNTRVYCAHEYTQENLRFANEVEPTNSALQKRSKEVIALRQNGLASIPSTIGLELKTNPFLRARQVTVKSRMEQHVNGVLNSSTEVFAAIREWKDHF